MALAVQFQEGVGKSLEKASAVPVTRNDSRGSASPGTAELAPQFVPLLLVKLPEVIVEALREMEEGGTVGLLREKGDPPLAADPGRRESEGDPSTRLGR